MTLDPRLLLGAKIACGTVVCGLLVAWMTPPTTIHPPAPSPLAAYRSSRMRPPAFEQSASSLPEPAWQSSAQPAEVAQAPQPASTGPSAFVDASIQLPGGPSSDPVEEQVSDANADASGTGPVASSRAGRSETAAHERSTTTPTAVANVDRDISSDDIYGQQRQTWLAAMRHYAGAATDPQ